MDLRSAASDTWNSGAGQRQQLCGLGMQDAQEKKKKKGLTLSAAQELKVFLQTLGFAAFDYIQPIQPAPPLPHSSFCWFSWLTVSIHTSASLASLSGCDLC